MVPTHPLGFVEMGIASVNVRVDGQAKIVQKGCAMVFLIQTSVVECVSATVLAMQRKQDVPCYATIAIEVGCIVLKLHLC